MSIIFEKMQNYKNNEFPEHEAHYQTLTSGQSPHTLLITCADSRLCPQEFTQTKAGEIFVVRNAGNLVPSYDANNPSNEGLTIEYGITALNIGEIVVCGHASCGAMGGLKDTSKLDAVPLVQKGLENYKNAFSSEIEGKDLDQLISWNVDNQMKSIFTYPFIKERLSLGQLKVFGMVYDFVHGTVTYRSQLTTEGEVIS